MCTVLRPLGVNPKAVNKYVKIEGSIPKVPDDVMLHSRLFKLMDFVHHPIFKQRKYFRNWNCSHCHIKMWEIHTQINPAEETILSQWMNKRQWAKSRSQVIQIWHGFPPSIKDVAKNESFHNIGKTFLLDPADSLQNFTAITHFKQQIVSKSFNIQLNVILDLKLSRWCRFTVLQPSAIWHCARINNSEEHAGSITWVEFPPQHLYLATATTQHTTQNWHLIALYHTRMSTWHPWMWSHLRITWQTKETVKSYSSFRNN
jgi:hypothetical protein